MFKLPARGAAVAAVMPAVVVVARLAAVGLALAGTVAAGPARTKPRALFDDAAPASRPDVPATGRGSAGVPAALVAAQERLDADAAAARADRGKALTAAAADYRAALKRAMSAAMKAEDLDEANRVKSAADAADKTLPGETVAVAADPPKGVVSGAARRVYEAAVERARGDADKAAEAARARYLADADAAVTAAKGAGDTDIAKAIAAAAKVVRDRSVAALLEPPRVRRPVVAFGKNAYLQKLLPAIGDGTVRYIDRKGTAAAIADPATYAGGPVVVWNQNVLRDTPIDQITPAAVELMRGHVRDGGDLVVFEQFEAKNMKPLDAAFGMRTTGGAPGGDFVDPEMAARAKAAGVTDEDAAKLALWNEYYDLPPEARVLVRARRNRGEADPAGIAVVPVGKGRLILIGMEPKPFKTVDAAFGLLYGYDAALAAPPPAGGK